MPLETINFGILSDSGSDSDSDSDSEYYSADEWNIHAVLSTSSLSNSIYEKECKELIRSLPHRVDDIGKYMWEKCQTDIMYNLYRDFKSQSNTRGMIQVVKLMFEEYIKECIIKNINLNFDKLYIGENKINFDNYKRNTQKWLERKFADFHYVNLNSENSLQCGKPQAGKSAFTFGIALMMLLEKKPCVFVVRNYTQDAEHMKAKINRFSNEHKNYMHQLGFNTTPSINVIDAVQMSLKKIGEDEDGKDIFKVNNFNNVKKALRGESMQIVIAIANGTQLKCINMVLDQLDNENEELSKLVLLTDEADAIGYSEILSPSPSKHKADEYNTLKTRAKQNFEISATVWDVLIGNKELLNTDIVIVRPPPTYKGIRDGVQYIKLPHKIEKWDSKKSLFDEDPNLIGVYEELMSVPIYRKERYNCEINHPVIVLHKTRREVKHHEDFFELFKTDNDYKYKWTVITECEKGINLYSDTLRGKCISIGKKKLYDDLNSGEFSLGNCIIIPQLLQWFIDNGGANRFSYIVIKSGQFSGRSRSYVSSNGMWHLTHQYYNGGSSVPDMIQAQRLLHDRPDSIPLIEYAPEKVIKDIRKGDILQDEQIERLISLCDQVYTNIQVEEELWNKEKVPSKKLYVGKINNGFKTKKIKGDDGGWSITDYKVEIDQNNDFGMITEIPNNRITEKEIFNYVLKILLNPKDTNIKKFLSTIHIDNKYRESDLLGLLEKAEYKQPNNILGSFTTKDGPNNYGSKFRLFNKENNLWIPRDGLINAIKNK